MLRSMFVALFFVVVSAASAQAQCDINDPNCSPKVHPNADLKEARTTSDSTTGFAIDSNDLSSLSQLEVAASSNAALNDASAPEFATLSPAEVQVAGAYHFACNRVTPPLFCDLANEGGSPLSQASE